MAATAWNTLLSAGSAAKTLPDEARAQAPVWEAATQTAVTIIQRPVSRPAPKIEPKAAPKPEVAIATEKVPQDTIDRLRSRIAAHDSVTTEVRLPPESRRVRIEDPGSVFAAALRAIPAAKVASPLPVTPPINVNEPRRARGAIPVHRHPVGYFPRSSRALVGADAFGDTARAFAPAPPPSQPVPERAAETVARSPGLALRVTRRLVIALSATAAAFTIGLVAGMFARDLHGVPSVPLVRTAAAETATRRVDPRSIAAASVEVAERNARPIEINLDELAKPRTFVRISPRRIASPPATATAPASPTTPAPRVSKPSASSPSSSAGLFEDRD